MVGWQPPWTGQGLEFFRNHVFYEELKGVEFHWDRLTGALEAITDDRLQELAGAVPEEWKAKSDAVAQIVNYVKEARRNRNQIISVITRFLQ